MRRSAVRRGFARRRCLRVRGGNGGVLAQSRRPCASRKLAAPARGRAAARGDPMTVRHRIAVVPGEGMRNGVVPEGMRVLDAAASKHGFELRWDQYPWSCAFYQKHGRMMPEDGLA